MLRVYAVPATTRKSKPGNRIIKPSKSLEKAIPSPRPIRTRPKDQKKNQT
jgi:hypothetical protein